MKAQLRFVALSLFAALCLAAVPAMADSYDNGPVNGNVNAWAISSGSTVSDSFQARAVAAKGISGMYFDVWVLPGDTISSVDVSITSDPNGGALYTSYSASKSGIKTIALGTNGFGYELEQVSIPGVNVNLDDGTYWLNLQNAQTDQGDPVFWDENSGPSLAVSSDVGTIPSEGFTIDFGDSGTTPEPSSLALFGSGVIGLAALLRRRIG